MSTRLPLICLVAFCFGCSKQSNSVSPAAAPASAPAATTDGEISNQAQIAAVLNELTQTARRYAAEHQRVPKSIDELVGNGYLNAMPQAPPGKRFAISRNLQVYLANQ